MTEERKQAIQITLAYTCIMVAVAFGAFAFSLWLVISGRLFRDGVDGVFLFAVLCWEVSSQLCPQFQFAKDC